MFHVRQHSAFSKFQFQIFSTDDRPIAELEWPWYAQAKKERLKAPSEGSEVGDVFVRLASARAASTEYRIGLEFLNTSKRQDVRFSLHQGGEPLALAEALFPKERLKRSRVEILSPLNATMVRHGSVGKLHYCWERDGRTLGTIEEPSRFALKRSLTVNLPSTISLPVQIFMSFLVINDAFL